MSKSLGNVVDPIEVMDEYGTDALRFTLATSSTPGNDMKLVPARIVGNRNFANKIWNAARFVIGQTAAMGGDVPALETLQPKTLADRWILSRAQRLAREVTRLMENYEFGEAGRQIYDFFWSEYCDWYLEVAKSAAPRRGDGRAHGADSARDAGSRAAAAASLHAVRDRGDLAAPLRRCSRSRAARHRVDRRAVAVRYRGVLAAN